MEDEARRAASPPPPPGRHRGRSRRTSRWSYRDDDLPRTGVGHGQQHPGGVRVEPIVEPSPGPTLTSELSPGAVDSTWNGARSTANASPSAESVRAVLLAVSKSCSRRPTRGVIGLSRRSARRLRGRGRQLDVGGAAAVSSISARRRPCRSWRRGLLRSPRCHDARASSATRASSTRPRSSSTRVDDGGGSPPCRSGCARTGSRWTS